MAEILRDYSANSTNSNENRQSNGGQTQTPSKQSDAEFARMLAYHLLQQQPDTDGTTCISNSLDEQTSENTISLVSPPNRTNVSSPTISDAATLDPDANMATYGPSPSKSDNTSMQRTYLFNYKDYCLPSDERLSGHPLRGLKLPFSADVRQILSKRINSILYDYRHYKLSNEKDANSTSSSSSSVFSLHGTPVSIKTVHKKFILSDVPRDKKLVKVRRKSW